MKIKKSRIFTENVKGLFVNLRELKDNIRKAVKEKGLYALEKYFGECASHGAGFGGEDISFRLKIGKKKYIIDINYNGSSLEITERIELFTQNREYWDSETASEPDKILVKSLKQKLLK